MQRVPVAESVQCLLPLIPHALEVSREEPEEDQE